MGRSVGKNDTSVIVSARRLARGKQTRPPYELMAYLLAREFGVTPDVIGERSAADVMRWWALYAELSQTQKGAS